MSEKKKNLKLYAISTLIVLLLESPALIFIFTAQSRRWQYFFIVLAIAAFVFAFPEVCSWVFAWCSERD